MKSGEKSESTLMRALIMVIVRLDKYKQRHELDSQGLLKKVNWA